MFSTEKDVETHIQPREDYFCAALHYVQSCQNTTRSKELSNLMTKTSLTLKNNTVPSQWIEYIQGKPGNFHLKDHE